MSGPVVQLARRRTRSPTGECNIRYDKDKTEQMAPAGKAGNRYGGKMKHLGKAPIASSVDAIAAVSGRLTTSTVAREALERYPWPFWNRCAGYISVCAAVLGTIFSEDLSNLAGVVGTLVLGTAFLWAFHLLSGGLAPLSRHQCIWLVVMQVASTLILYQLITDNFTGPMLLLFAIACELQFIAGQRIALAGVAGLWLLNLTAFALIPVTNLHWAHMHMEVPRSFLLDNGASSLAGFIFVVAFTRSAVTELIQRHQTTILLDELRATYARLQGYANQVEELSVARERNRLAREIHDTLGHYLTVINVQIETAQKLGTRDPARSQAALATAKSLASECLAEVRRSVAALRPSALDDVSLPEAVGHLVDDLRRSSDLTLHVESHAAGALPAAVEVVVYRVIQEALTNVRKHAQARNVWVRIDAQPDWITASVSDDGRGTPPELPHAGSPPAEGYGLPGMRERVEAMGGTLEIETAPGRGFAVTVRLPRSHDVPGAAQHGPLEQAHAEAHVG